MCSVSQEALCARFVCFPHLIRRCVGTSCVCVCVCGLVEDSSLPGSDTVSLGDWLLTLEMTSMTRFSGTESCTILTMI